MSGIVENPDRPGLWDRIINAAQSGSLFVRKLRRAKIVPDLGATDSLPPDFLAEAEKLTAYWPDLVIDVQNLLLLHPRLGEHGRRRAGAGSNFWQFRTARSGDSLAAIDWRQSARSERLYIRETEQETAETIRIWCDLSHSMQYRSARQISQKSDHAQILSLAMAMLLLRAGERVGLAGAREEIFANRDASKKIAHRLFVIDQQSDETQNASLPPPTPLREKEKFLLMISDFLLPIDMLADRFGQIAAQGGQLCGLAVHDPAEIEFPFSGRIEFRHAEEKQSQIIERSEQLGARYREIFARHMSDLEKLFTDFGWRFAAYRTDHGLQAGLQKLCAMLAPDPGWNNVLAKNLS